MGSFLADAPEIYQSVIAEIEDALQNGRKLAEYFPQNLQPPLLAFSDNLDGLFGKLVSRAAEPTVQIAGHVAKSIPNLLVNMVITILSSYLFLADRESIMLWLKGHLPAFIFRYIEYMKRDAKGVIGGYFLAQFRIMCVVALILAAGFWCWASATVSCWHFDGDSGFSADLWNGNGAVPMGGCEAVRGGVCVCDRAYPALHPDAGRPSDHPAEDRRGVDGIAASDDPVSLYLGFKLRGLTGMILAVPVGLVFINFINMGRLIR